MSDAASPAETAVSTYAQQVGRGVVFLLILQYSLGIGVSATVQHAFGPTPIVRPTIVSTVVVALVVAVLVNSAHQPSYRQLTGFTVVAFVIGTAVTTLVGGGDGHVGALYPTLQTGLSWLGAFCIAYAVAFEVEWSRVVEVLLTRPRE
ncbi:hypothetical protein [Haloferax sp. ATB1]|uniref:hypothetical protein n=1 Tax=Haloferax sp. ATB1 TaxID=1508454 RepID=UPI0005B2050B|nr:hypothetical protein [Haloferax sp. ATB1]